MRYGATTLPATQRQKSGQGANREAQVEVLVELLIEAGGREARKRLLAN
jgi:hypothetical protein